MACLHLPSTLGAADHILRGVRVLIAVIAITMFAAAVALTAVALLDY
jgi:hypothetical protein